MKNLIKKILKESDFDWVGEIEYEPTAGDTFKVKGTRYVWTLYDIIKGSERDGYQFHITPHPGRGIMSDWQTISLDSIKYHLDTGNWVPIKLYGEKIKENLKESDLEWMGDVPDDPYDDVMDLSEDYVGEWEHLKTYFNNACITILEGKVTSSDYSGYVRVKLKTREHGGIETYLDYEYEDETNTVHVKWNVYQTSRFYNHREGIWYNSNMSIGAGTHTDEEGVFGPLGEFIETKLNVCGK